MVLVRRLAYVASLLLVPACGQSLNKAPPTVTEDLAGTTPTNARDFAMVDAKPSAMIDMAGFNTAGSPVVTIISPKSSDEIPTPTLTVSVTVTSPTNAVIDTSSVMVQLTPPGGTVLTAPLSPSATTPGQFTGSITLPESILSGAATFSVVASDVNGLMGSAEGSYVRDRGPNILFILPTTTPQKGGLITVQIIIEDTLHPVTDVSQVQVGIRALSDVTVKQVAGQLPFQVTGSFDSTTFTPPLDGAQQITATVTSSNASKTVTTGRQAFSIDDSGPLIDITAPNTTDFAPNPMSISVTVTDALSQLDTNSVYATIGGNSTMSVHLQLMGPVTQPATGGYSGIFIGTFDLRALGSYVYPELSIEAKDVLGNTSQLGEEILVDNTKPWLTMDGSIKLYVAKHPSGGTTWECAAPFQPLGTEALRDQQTLHNIQLLNVRARIQDQGNYAPGQDGIAYSGIDPSTVKMYAIPDDGTTALAVDTDADGICDAVNPVLVPTDELPQKGQVLSLGMVPRPTGGTPDYTPYSSPTVLGCDSFGDASASPPVPLCNYISSSLDYILYSSDAQTGTQVYTIGPVVADPNSLECLGRQLDTMNYFNEGWNCLITTATDMTGNSMASYPIHVCIDRGNGKCTTTSVPASDCTGVYDTTTKAIVPGNCSQPPVPTTTNPVPNPGTFPTNNLEVVHLPS